MYLTILLIIVNCTFYCREKKEQNSKYYGWNTTMQTTLMYMLLSILTITAAWCPCTASSED